MDITIKVLESGSASILVRELVGVMQRDLTLAGRVEQIAGQPVPDALGVTPEDVTVAVTSVAIAKTLASVAITWIRQRSPKFKIVFVRPDGAELAIEAERAAGLSFAELQSLATELADKLNPSAE